MTEALDIDHLRSWIGRTETHDDLMSPWTASALAATLRNEAQPWPAGRALPPLWHWCYFLPTAPETGSAPTAIRRAAASCRRCRCRAACGPAAGSNSSPRCRRRRMRADLARRRRQARSRARRRAGLRHGRARDACRRRRCARAKSTTSSTAKPRSAGERRRRSRAGRCAWPRNTGPTPALLFRYSALTFNSHRIHYDHPYVTQVEGYGPGRARPVDRHAAARSGAGSTTRPRPCAAYTFKAVRPLTCGRLLHVCGQRPRPTASPALWAEGPRRRAADAGHRTPGLSRLTLQ